MRLPERPPGVARLLRGREAANLEVVTLREFAALGAIGRLCRGLSILLCMPRCLLATREHQRLSSRNLVVACGDGGGLVA